MNNPGSLSLWGRWSLCLKGQLKVIDDLVYDLMIFYKRDNAHGSTAFGTDERIDLIDFTYHLSPSSGRYKYGTGLLYLLLPL